MMNTTSNIYLIRHGDRYNWLDRDWNKKVVVCGGLLVDSPLSPVGHQQARETAMKLQDVQADGILTSPYLRTIQTAVPFAEQKGLPICIEHGLAEVNHIPNLLPDVLRRYLYFPHIDTDYTSMIMPVASENNLDRTFNKPQEIYPEEYFERMLRFAKVLEKEVSGKTLICISHAASLALVAALLKCDLEDIPGDSYCDTNDRTDLFAPVGVFHLSKNGNGPWKLISNGSTNNHVSRRDPTSHIWGYKKDMREIWTNRFKPSNVNSLL